MTLSIVTTLYKSSEYVDEFYQRITAAAEKITKEYEIIFVDDGSPDDSLQKAISLHKKDNKVTVVELSRNFGHHKAIMTGLSFAKGDHVFLIDSDLEEEPELLTSFWNELHLNSEIDVVYGIQKSRKGGLFERFSGGLFWTTFNLMSDVKVPENILTARLMKSQYVSELIKYKEKELFLGGLFHITGFRQKPIEVKKLSSSASTYTLRKKLSLLLNAVTSFSSFPLKLIFYLGLLISFFSILYIIWILGKKILFNISLEGWTSLIISVWFLGGLILISIGTIGIYLSKIFSETKSRPYSSIRSIYKSGAN